MLNSGLDIGEHSLKCAVVETESGRIQDLWQAELFPERSWRNQIFEGKIFRERLAETLRKCRKECAGFKPRVVTVVQGMQTSAGYIEPPVFSGPEIETAITSQAIQQVPFPIESVTLSHVLVPPIDHKRERKGAFFVAARRNLVEELKSVLEGCDIEVSRVEVPSLALVREFSRNHKPLQGEFIVLIHLGFRFTQIVILRDGYPYWTRDFSPSGRDFTYGIQVARDLTWKRAEEEKRNHRSDLSALEIEPQLKQCAEEIKKSLDFFAAHFSEKPITFSNIFLSGGSSSLRGLDRYLSAQLEIPVQIDRWNRIQPLQNINGEATPAVNFKIAVGLALEQ